MPANNGKRRREERREEARLRQKARDILTDAEQLRVLDFRLGKGQGAERERARLGNKE